MAKLLHDKYYTPIDVAKRLIETTFNVLEQMECKITDRNFIGIELDENYFRIVEERIKGTIMKRTLI